MPPLVPGAGSRPTPRTGDTLDLRLPSWLTAAGAPLPGPPGPAGPPTAAERLPGAGPAQPPPAGARSPGKPAPSRFRHAGAAGRDRPWGTEADDPARWRAATTPWGPFQLVPVDPDRDLALLTRWMNDPAVNAFWELAGPPSTTAAHLRAQLATGHCTPCLGVLAGAPVSYWEVYRADLDPLAEHYPARPHDRGLHLLIGDGADRGRGLGRVLLRAAADLVLDHAPDCTRVVAEPDVRNGASLAAFLAAGFRVSAEIDLPEKRAALMVRDRPRRGNR